MNKRILISLSVIGAVAAIAIGGTIAYFSDTETSVGNTFTAGAIDLSLGGDFTSTNNGSLLMALDPNNNGRVLYTFTDLKPGDMGGGSFNLQVTSNEAYVCANSAFTAYPENGINDPEATALDTTASVGELQDYLQFATFDDDDEDGVYDAGIEPINVNQYGGDSNGFTPTEIDAANWVPVADTTFPNTWLVATTIPTATLQSAGMLYCFGNFTTTGSLDTTQVTGCDGTGNQNIAQTDGVVGSIEFSAVQTRNNPNFTCASMNPQPEIITVVSRGGSSPFSFSSTGWAGLSCPSTHPNVVSGGVSQTNVEPWVAPAFPISFVLAETGATLDGSTYPVFPHYNYPAGEEGIAIHNGGTAQSLYAYLKCQAN